MGNPQTKLVLTARELQLEQDMRVMRARNGLLNFIRYTKPNYQVNWHHRLMARRLNDVVEGRCQRLIITMPPRHGKSEAVSVRFPAYALGRNPHAQIIAASYNATLAAKMNRSVQRVIDSPTYAEVFPETCLNNSNVRTTAQGSWLRNSDEFEVVNHGGFYRSTGVGGSATGYGATIGIIDDYCKNRDEANSAVYREKVWDWYTSTFYTRLEKDGAIIICATRWHDDELIGRLLKQAKDNPEADQWTLLNLPAMAEADNDLEDPRDPGDILWPEKYPKKKMAKMRATIGERDWVSLYQQRPAPAEGEIIKKAWFKFWRDLPEDIELLVLSADLNAKERERSDFTVFTIWIRSGSKFYLVDMVRERMGWVKQKVAFARLIEDYPGLTDMYIEDASNGTALVQEVQDTVPGVVAVLAKGSKVTRLEAVSALIQSGSVYLPDPTMPGYEWVHDVINEICVFPNGKNDDIVDSVTQALSQMRSKITEYDFTAQTVDKESFTAGLADAG